MICCFIISIQLFVFFFFFFNDTATTEIYTLSLHDALPIWFFQGTHRVVHRKRHREWRHSGRQKTYLRSEEHTSELQSQSNLVCRLLLEKKKNKKKLTHIKSNNYATHTVIITQ